MKINKCKLCVSCPASTEDGGPSTCALERINYIQTTKNKPSEQSDLPGCPWYTNAPEYGYCFWQLARDIHGAGMSDKEICHLELIPISQIKDVIASATAKLLKAFNKGDPNVVEFVETLRERVAAHNNSDLELSEEIREYIDKMESEVLSETDIVSSADIAPKKRGRKKKKVEGMGLPMHRSGKKIDLFGLYSDKTKQRIREEKKQPIKTDDKVKNV